MPVGSESAVPAHRRHIAQMLAVFRHVDGEILVEGQQAGGDDAGRDEIAEARHDCPPPRDVRANDRSGGSGGARAVGYRYSVASVALAMSGMSMEPGKCEMNSGGFACSITPCGVTPHPPNSGR